MILTTNRVRSLDTAVVSRFHLAIRYDELDRKQMCSILFTILEKSTPGDAENERIKTAFDEWLEDNNAVKFNGRQIRNIVTAALALARADNRDTITYDTDIRAVVKATRGFQTQLENLIPQERMRREVTKDRT